MFCSMKTRVFGKILTSDIICSGKDLTVAVHYQIQPTVGFLVDHTFEPVRVVHVPDQ